MGEPTPPVHIHGTSQPGWYPDPEGRTVRRYFDGIDWTDHWEPLPVEQRTAILQAELVKRAGPGVTVTAQSATTARLVYRQGNAVAVHLILALLTCGAWLLVWLVIAASTNDKALTLSVDQYGEVSGVWSH